MRLTFTSLNADFACALSNSVNRLGTALARERIQRPIRVGDHLESAMWTNENRHLRARFTARSSRHGSFKNALRLFGKSGHEPLIGGAANFLTRFELAQQRA
jgi:hypothetical protein